MFNQPTLIMENKTVSTTNMTDKRINSYEGRKLTAELYHSGLPIQDIADELNRLGFTQNNGSVIPNSLVSTVAHKMGCPRRIKKTHKKKSGRPLGSVNRVKERIEQQLAQPLWAAPVERDTKLEDIVTLAGADIPTELKKRLIAQLLDK